MPWASSRSGGRRWAPHRASIGCPTETLRAGRSPQTRRLLPGAHSAVRFPCCCPCRQGSSGRPTHTGESESTRTHTADSGPQLWYRGNVYCAVCPCPVFSRSSARGKSKVLKSPGKHICRKTRFRKNPTEANRTVQARVVRGSCACVNTDTHTHTHTERGPECEDGVKAPPGGVGSRCGQSPPPQKVPEDSSGAGAAELV